MAGDAGTETRVVILTSEKRHSPHSRSSPTTPALTAAPLTAIGAFERVTVGWFDFREEDLQENRGRRQCEVLSAIGDLRRRRRQGQPPRPRRSWPFRRHHAWRSSSGGWVRPTLEVVLIDTPAHLRTEEEDRSRHRPDRSRRDQEALISVASSGEGGYSCVPRTIAGWGEGLIQFTGWKTNSCPGEFPDNRSRAPAFWRIANESVASKSCWSTPAARTGARRTTVPGRSRKARSTRRKIQSRPPAASSPKNSVPGGLDRPLQALGEVRQRGGKRVIAFCGEADFDTTSLVSNSFEIEWPPSNGRIAAFPEVDRAAWFDLNTVRSKILSGRSELLHQLEKIVP